jgi:hypothetical protein
MPSQFHSTYKSLHRHWSAVYIDWVRLRSASINSNFMIYLQLHAHWQMVNPVYLDSFHSP